MRISAAQRTENENRIRATMDRLLRGEIPPGGKGDIKTLAHEAAVDRTAFYGTRPYTHLRAEFERRLNAVREASEIPDLARPRSPGSRKRTPSSRNGSPSPSRRSTSSRTSAPRPWPASPPSTKRSSGSARSLPAPLGSATCRHPEPPSSGHAADAAYPTGCWLSHGESWTSPAIRSGRRRSAKAWRTDAGP